MLISDGLGGVIYLSLQKKSINLVMRNPTLDKNSGWSVTVENLVTNQTVTSDFKAMMICNGHYSIPSLPDLPGLSKFSGVTQHSHDYRTSDPFQVQYS